jgi:septal ring factor EnvC (AmiA/AmiB activator)
VVGSPSAITDDWSPRDRDNMDLASQVRERDDTIAKLRAELATERTKVQRLTEQNARLAGAIRQARAALEVPDP